MLDPEVLEGFAGSLLSPRFDNPCKTPKFHKELWELCCSDAAKVAIAAPRGHAKSTAVTHCYVLASVLFMQKSNVMILADTETQGVQFLTDIRMELEENQDLREIFQIHGFLKDNEKELIVSMGDSKHLFRIFVKATGQSLRGSKWRGKRPDLILGDDMENDEMVTNPERRAKFKRWLLAALLPSLSDKGQIRIVGTILHADGLLEWCLNANGWKTARYEAHNDDFSTILWPEKFSKERLLNIRKDYEEAGELDVYAQEYRNQPIDESQSHFRSGDFIDIKDEDEYLEYYIGVDLAISQKQTADFSVFAVIGVNKAGKLKVVDIVRGRFDSLRIVEEVFTLQKRYHPQYFLFEDDNINKSIGPFLYREMQERNVYPLIETIRPSKDKLTRARALIAMMRAGNMEYYRKSEWFADLFMEMKYFPRGKHDDQVDALSIIGLFLQNLFEADDTSTYEDDPDDDDWDQEDEWDMFASDRNSTTGY